MNKQIYITRIIPESGLKLLRDKGITYDIGPSKNPPTKKEIIKALKKKPYDGVIFFLTDPIDKEVFDACPTAKAYASYCVGYENIDIEEAKKRGICVSNTPGTSSLAVAEHTVALMLALTTRLNEGDRFMREGKYKGWDPYLLIGTDLSGKTVGLIGSGQIGSRVAQIIHDGFGANVIYHDVVPNKDLEEKFNIKNKEFTDIIKESDIISLHVPLLPTTHHLINKETFSMMKKTAFLVNTSRGAVIDEKALLEALKSNTIAGAGLDVYEFEPKVTKGLTKLSNIVLTPHIASARESARDKMAEVAALNIISVFETGKAINNCS